MCNYCRKFTQSAQKIREGQDVNIVDVIMEIKVSKFLFLLNIAHGAAANWKMLPSRKMNLQKVVHTL